MLQMDNYQSVSMVLHRIKHLIVYCTFLCLSRISMKRGLFVLHKLARLCLFQRVKMLLVWGERYFERSFQRGVVFYNSEICSPNVNRRAISCNYLLNYASYTVIVVLKFINIEECHLKRCFSGQNDHVSRKTTQRFGWLTTFNRHHVS